MRKSTSALLSAVLLFLLSGTVFAWFTASSATRGNELIAGAPEGALELWVQLPGDEGSFSPISAPNFSSSMENEMSGGALCLLPDGGALYLLDAADGAASGNSLLRQPIRPGEQIARRLLVRNCRKDASMAFLLSFPAPGGKPPTLAEELRVSLLRIGTDAPPEKLADLDGLGLWEATFSGTVPQGGCSIFELQIERAAAAFPHLGESYRAEVVVEARGAFSGIHAVSTGEELSALLSGESALQNGDTIVLYADLSLEHLIADRCFNLDLNGHMLTVEGSFAVNRPVDGEGNDLFATMEIGGGTLRVNGEDTVLRDGIPTESIRFSLNCPGTAVRWTAEEDSDAPQPGAGELNVRAFNGIYGEPVTDEGLGILSAP